MQDIFCVTLLDNKQRNKKMTGTLQKTDRKTKIRKGEPITENGLVFYPITMDYYDDFIRCKDVIVLRQASLPVRYLSMDYLSALFAMEIDAIKSKQPSAGLFQRALAMLYLSLRVEYSIEELNRNITVSFEKNRIALKSIKVKQNDKIAEFTPLDFSFKFRRIIAEQNGLELPDESENFDIIKDYEKLKTMKGNSKKLNVNMDDLISSVAYLSRVSEREIMRWTVREFENRRRAIDRDKRYTLCGQGEMSGMVSFKNGNPAPSWEFDVIEDGFGTMETKKLQDKLSGVAEERK